MIRLLDILLSLIGLILTSPILLIVTILGYFETKSPIFIQERVGKNKKSFKLIKFRTMAVDTKSVASHLVGTASITKLGGFLRKTKIDELPQLINVLKGDMSLIGPRPLLVKYLPLYSTEQIRRHNVRPGISGWAQCHGRNTLSWTEKFKLDVWYVDHVSFITDVKVVFITIKNVLMRKDIDNKVNNGSGRFTQEEFNGQN